MFNSVVLDVVIGLFFIYLLYSLLVTIVSELLATMLHLRARNLKVAIDRMLNDEKPSKWRKRLWNSIKLLKSPNNEVVDAFYNNPEIKYLGSSGLFKSPSNFKAKSFAKTVMSLITGDESITSTVLNTKLKSEITIKGKTENGEKIEKKLEADTAKFIRELWQESQGDIEKFKLLLEDWFERTMEQTIEWYKRKIRLITFVLGFLLAWLFNADTFVIVNTLSTDKVAREQMVSMANAYIQNNPESYRTTVMDSGKNTVNYEEKLDSLLRVKKQLQADISKANNILGLGGFPPDSVSVRIGENLNAEKIRIYSPVIDEKGLSGKDKSKSSGYIKFTFGQKIAYFFRLFYHHFWGFHITAFAISLGAPFWFDLLNKFMKLKTSSSEENKGSNSKSTTDIVSPLNRVG